MGAHRIIRALARATTPGLPLVTAVALAVASTAAAAELQTASMTKTPEDRAVAAFLTYCLPAVTAGDSVARSAATKKLRAVPAAEQAAYLQGEPGSKNDTNQKVFELPSVGPGAVLTAGDDPTCSIALERVDAREFLEQATYWFGTGQSAFKLTSNRTLPNGDIEREYKADVDGDDVVLRLSLRLKPVPGAAQAMLTGTRAAK
ncbi:MAG: hypothetical protein ACM30I_07955 [Gemmatimonas sp.]